MKTKLNNTIKATMLFIFTLMGAAVFAQSYYTPGQTYTFRNKINANQCIKVDVVFDANGNATVSKSLVAAETTDKANSFVFGPENEVEYNSSTSTIRYQNSADNYFVLNLNTTDFDSEAPTANGEATITCSCKEFKVENVGNCKIDSQTNGGIICVFCANENGCTECWPPKVTIKNSSGVFTNINHQVLIIKANNISYN